MDWVARQTDEITNKLLTLPNLVIVLPKDFSQNGVQDGKFSNFLEKFNTKTLSSGIDELKEKMGKAYDAKLSEAQSKASNRASSSSPSSGYSLIDSGRAGLTSLQ